MSKRLRVIGGSWGALALMGTLAGCPKGGGTQSSNEDPNFKAVRTQIRVFATTNRRAPKPDEGLGVLFNGQIPKDPWGNEIQYIVPGPNGSAFDLLSYGADGAPGGKKEDSDLLWSAIKP